ncbi:hypothetical protein P691DRAFT_796790 [Macrolepiota fuliginosa MF-IS2]|uniref:RNA exonuclease 4 n=1 Tax=Macrolepiota fuliginosa MF-IS2 TaxID=1400762 RepID=A0A9P6C077_9AGAR|nr:hypothetical protein P691DRAFT_796790 [Macrolepiota fuliginosa MF-IS2]
MSNPGKNTAPASSNWLALQKASIYPKNQTASHSRKRRKLEHAASRTNTHSPSPTPSTSTRYSVLSTSHGDHDDHAANKTTGTSVNLTPLRDLVHGKLTYTPSQNLPGRYLAIDCEMVGVGIDGEESSLARVSMVNWYGAVQLDVFVRQRERVVDYRTQWSGIREKDMVGAKPFPEVQKQVADMLKDKILIGHAVHNDLKALLLSHPRQSTRDTQVYARKFNLTKSKRIALRVLVKEQLGLTIQEGEHSSVTDARATMAIYRIHKKEWEKGVKPVEFVNTKKRKRDSTKGKERADEDDEDDEAEPATPSTQRKGISSGLSMVIRRQSKKAWWSELPSSSSKGSIRLKM